MATAAVVATPCVASLLCPREAQARNGRSAMNNMPLRRRSMPTFESTKKIRANSSRFASVVRAAKLPAGVEEPKEEPKLPTSLWGFTEIAEVWNSRVAMIGILALLAVEFITNKGILQIIGVDVGKGLNLPL